MNKIPCFDVFEMVAGDVQSDFLTSKRVNDGKLAQLKRSCEVLDEISEDSEGVGFSVDINEDTGIISISFDFLYEINILTEEIDFGDLAQSNTKGIVITKTDTEDMLRITLVFDSIWD